MTRRDHPLSVVRYNAPFWFVLEFPQLRTIKLQTSADSCDGTSWHVRPVIVNFSSIILSNSNQPTMAPPRGRRGRVGAATTASSTAARSQHDSSDSSDDDDDNDQGNRNKNNDTRRRGRRQRGGVVAAMDVDEEGGAQSPATSLSRVDSAARKDNNATIDNSHNHNDATDAADATATTSSRRGRQVVDHANNNNNNNNSEQEHEEDSSILKILLSTDNHLGYCERDPIRSRDSFAAFEEMLSIARQNKVDMVLLSGDLFHENKPSRKTLHTVSQVWGEYL